MKRVTIQLLVPVSSHLYHHLYHYLYILFSANLILYEITASSHETKASQDPLTPTKSSSIEEDASFRM